MEEALKSARMRDALAWTTNDRHQAQDPDTPLHAWLWQAIQGDFNEDRTAGQIAFDAAISMIPLVDQICDLRDLVANCRKIRQDPADEWAWVALALTLIGLFPTLGSLVKGVLKIVFLQVRRYGLDHLVKAMDDAMGWVITFLRKREVQHYLRRLKVDKVFGWLAGRVREVRGQVSVESLLAAFDEGIRVMRGLLEKVAVLPAAAERARKTLDAVLEVRRMADEPLRRALEPVQRILDTFEQRLVRESMLVRRALHNTNNMHFRGGLPEASAVTLLKNEPAPKWLSEGRSKPYPEIDIYEKSRSKLAVNIATAEKAGYPRILPDPADPNSKGVIATFHAVKSDIIRGPAKLYRIVSPSSAAMSDCWISEAVFLQLQKAPDPRAAWRKHLGVWPDWNANGQFVMYEVKAGEELKVWRGPAASQVRDDDFDLKKHLEGGWEQIVFNVPKRSPFNDAMAVYEKLPGGRLRGPLPPSQAGALAPESKMRLRQQINHPNIRGPYETGWGYTDFKEELIQERLGLPALPGQVTN